MEDHHSPIVEALGNVSLAPPVHKELDLPRFWVLHVERVDRCESSSLAIGISILGSQSTIESGLLFLLSRHDAQMM